MARRIAKGKQFQVDVAGSSTFGRYPKISAAKTYNMFMSDGFLVNYPGWKKRRTLLSADNAEGRGAFRSIRGSLAVAVVNDTVWEFDESLGIREIGIIDTSSGEVFMDENLNSQICIVDGLNAYIFNRDTKSLTTQSLPSDLTPNYVEFHNTYFLFGNADRTGDGAKWFAFSRDSDTTITQTYELALETKPDYAIAVVRLPGKANNVLVFGTSVTELHTNVGGLQGYRRVSSISIDYGCISVSTIAVSDTFVFWLATNENNSPVIMVFDGANATPISTDGIDFVLGNIQFPDQSTAFFYRIDGHLFYQLTFFNEADNLSLIYDVTAKKFYHVSDSNVDYHPARQVIFFNNSSYFVSLNNGAIYETDTEFTTYDENIVDRSNDSYDDDINNEIPRTRICTNVRLPTSAPFIARQFTLTLDQGNDLNHSQLFNDNSCSDTIITQSGDVVITQTGDDVITQTQPDCLLYSPKVDLSFSTDGGVTFSADVSREMQFTAHRRNMMSWQQMGMANDFTIRLKFWNTSRAVATNGILEVTQ